MMYSLVKILAITLVVVMGLSESAFAGNNNPLDSPNPTAVSQSGLVVDSTNIIFDNEGAMPDPIGGHEMSG